MGHSSHGKVSDKSLNHSSSSSFLCFKTKEEVDYLVNFTSSREEISRLGIKPPTTHSDLGTPPESFGSLGLSHTESIHFLVSF